MEVIPDCFVLLLKLPEGCVFEQRCLFVLLGMILQKFCIYFQFLSLSCKSVFKIIDGGHEFVIKGAVLVVELSSVILNFVVELISFPL